MAFPSAGDQAELPDAPIQLDSPAALTAELPPGDGAEVTEIAESADGETIPPQRGADPEPPPRRMRLRLGRPTWRSAGPWILAFGLLLVYCVDTIARYERFAPMSWDLGLFTEAVKQYAHFHAPIVDARSPGFNLLGEHFSPIIALLAPFWWIFPTPVMILVAQGALFALGSVPITRLGVERIGTGAGYALGAAYGLSFGLANAVDADFHEVAFAVPLISLALCAFMRDQLGRCAFWAFLLVFVKEDFGMAMVMPIGIAIILKGRPLLGAALSAAGTASSLLALYWILPALNPNHTYEFWSKEGCADPTAAVHQSPLCLIGQTAQSGGSKLELLFLLLAVTAFVALRSPLVILALPNLFSRLASNDSSFWGTAWHYNAPLMPLLFIAAADGIIRARNAGELDAAAGHVRRWARGVSDAMQRHGAVAMLAVAVALVPQFAYGQFFDPDTFSFDARTAALGHAMSLVPDGVSVETTLNMLAPLGARDDAYWVGNTNPATDYVVFDSVVSGFSPPVTNVLQFEEQRHPGVTYKIIYEDQWGIYVLEKAS